MKREIAQMLEKFGNSVQVVMTSKGGEKVTYSIKAFIQPLRYKNKLYLESTVGELGIEDEGAYLYIGPPEPSPDKFGENCKVICDGENYYVTRAEQIKARDEKLYTWAILKSFYRKGVSSVI